MNLLLDTHSLLWAAGAASHLSPTARKLIEDPAHQLWLSAGCRAPSCPARRLQCNFKCGRMIRFRLFNTTINNPRTGPYSSMRWRR